MRLTKVCMLIIATLCCSYGCVPKSAKLQKSVVPPDKTLFETGADYLNKGQYIRARLSFQTLISTYPDSDMAAEAIFATADSFYDEGGTENLLQAEDQYKNFIIFYPTSQKAPDAEMKIISLHMKRLRSPENDQEYSTRALQEIQLFQKLFPESDFVPIVKKLEIEVKDRLARQDLVIAKFYGDRGNYVGALGRYQDIREKYKEFTGMDEVLFRMATGFEKALRPEEAAICLTELVKGYPFSKLSEEATMRLEKMGKPIPPVDKVLAAANQANLKPSAPFVPWKFLADFATELGFKGPPDQYVLAKKNLEAEKAKAEETRVAAAKPGNKQEPVDINVVISKNVTGTTTDVILPSTPAVAAPNSEEDKKTQPRYNKKPPKKKPPVKTS